MKEPEKPVPPRLAATIVLLRETAGGLQALLLRRRSHLAFAGGDWVFPGGAVDAADSAEIMRRHLPPDSGFPSSELMSRVAACRETFEESGVLLARHKHTPQSRETLADIARAGDDLLALLQRYDLILNIDHLARWSNWITPSYAPRRFDTVFYVAAMPEDQQVVVDPRESQDAAWIPLDDPRALVPPLAAGPASLTIQELAVLYRECGSLGRLIERARQAPPVSIMVKMIRADEGFVGLLPWDAAYADAEGEGTDCTPAVRSRFRNFPSRFVIDTATRIPRPP